MTASTRVTTRFSAGAVNVRTGNFVYFDNTTHEIGPEHVMASGALPPGFPAIEIEGEHYWDGGLVSNTPLQWVLAGKPRQDTLAFQIDLWSASGASRAIYGGRDRARRKFAFPAARGRPPTILRGRSCCAARSTTSFSRFLTICGNSRKQSSRRRGGRESLQHHSP